jgi:hypothetical protein
MEEAKASKFSAAPSGGNPSLEAKISSMANNIVYLAVNRVLSKCAEKVLAEDDEVQVDGMVEDALSDSDDDLLGGEDVDRVVLL